MDNKNKTTNKNMKGKNKQTTHNKNKNINQENKKNNNNSNKVKTTKNTSKKVENNKSIKKNEEVKEIKQEVEVQEEIIAERNEANKEKSIQEKSNEKEFTSEVEDKPNKKGIIILLGILLVIVGICIFYQVDNKDKNTATGVTSEESSEIMDDFYKYFNSKKTRIIFYASSTCGYCKLETPIMEQIDKDYKINYLYVDASKLTKNDREKMLKELNIEPSTPTTVIVKDGKVIDTQVGYVDGGKMVEFLKENKILDKDAVYTPEEYITFINYEDFSNLIKEEGKHVITIGQTGCSHCIATKPVLNAIAKEYDIKLYYLNISEMTQSENASLINNLKELGYDEKEFLESGQFGTPLTIVIEKGKIVYYISGERPTKEFKSELKKAKVISE